MVSMFYSIDVNDFDTDSTSIFFKEKLWRGGCTFTQCLLEDAG